MVCDIHRYMCVHYTHLCVADRNNYPRKRDNSSFVKTFQFSMPDVAWLASHLGIHVVTTTPNISEPTDFEINYVASRCQTIHCSYFRVNEW